MSNTKLKYKLILKALEKSPFIDGAEYNAEYNAEYKLRKNIKKALFPY
jgi:hypothetical protein